MKVKSIAAPLFLCAILACVSTGCKKKVAVAPPAPPAVQVAAPPAPEAPSASLTAEPSTIERGQAVTLKWSSTGATQVAISGLEPVAAEGRRELRPTESTTYVLVARGPGGSITASASVNVVAPPPDIAPPLVFSKSLQDRVSELSDLYFDYDKSDLREDARAALAKDAEIIRSILVDFPNASIVVEGHCDELGSAEYNLALGDRRATGASGYLEALGIETTTLKTVSYGKERPQCTEASESCWQQNRRVHFSAGGFSTELN